MKMISVQCLWLFLILTLISCEQGPSSLEYIDWVEITTDKYEYTNGETIDEYTRTDGDTIHVHIKNNGDIPINITACWGRFTVDIERQLTIDVGISETIAWHEIAWYNAICDDYGIPYVTFEPGESIEQDFVLKGDFPEAIYRLRFFGDTVSESSFLYSNEFSIR